MTGMREYLGKISGIIVPRWPDATPLLHFRSCFELLIAVILSAQTTDEQVNGVTPLLFAAFPDPGSMAAASLSEIEELIHSVGFYRTKARHLVSTARALTERYQGTVPERMEDLLALPGVGRKTANLVISACFGEPGIIVDTHVMRVAVRLGIHGERNPEAIETVLRQNLDPEGYTAFSHALNRHGKYVCTARNPGCLRGGECPLEFFCPKNGIGDTDRNG